MCHTITKMHRVSSVFVVFLNFHLLFFFSSWTNFAMPQVLTKIPALPENRLCWLTLTSTPLYLSFREHKDSFELCSEGFFLKCTHWAKLCPGFAALHPHWASSEGLRGDNWSWPPDCHYTKKNFLASFIKVHFYRVFLKATFQELNSYSEHPGRES